MRKVIKKDHISLSPANIVACLKKEKVRLRMYRMIDNLLYMQHCEA